MDPTALSQPPRKIPMIEYSIIIPVYKSQDIVGATVKALHQVVGDGELNAEIILVNDGSPDASWSVIKKLAQESPRVIAIDLLKNYGQHNAVLCGLSQAQGRYAITMDDDLQNPPQEILRLIAKAQSGDYDLIFGKFRDKKHAAYRRWGSRLVGHLNSRIFGKPVNITLSNFRLIRRDVIERVLKHHTAYPYIPGLLLMYASSMANVEVEHNERAQGKSNYSLRKLALLMSTLLINYSSFPLRVLSGIGLFVAVISFLAGIAYFMLGLMGAFSVPGWTTLVALISFLGGFIIALLGVMGEYLSRILDQLSSNASYHIREIVQ